MTEFLSQSWSNLVEALWGLLIPALIFLVLAVLFKRKSWLTDIKRALPESGLNAQIILFNTLISLPILAVLVTGFQDMLRDANMILIDTDFWRSRPLWLVILITVFIGDFVAYWRHRLEHSALFWPAHAVHHSDTEMTWLSLERFHPINMMTTFFIDSTTLLVLGLPPYALVANNLVRHYYGYLIHADLPWTYGAFSRLFVSPAMHRWHHAADKRAFDTNYATVFSIFDRAFGTFWVPGPCDAPLGVTDDIDRSFSSQMLYAFQPRAYRRLINSWRRKRNHPTE